MARGALASGAAAAALLPLGARAEDESIGGGAFIGYHFGERSRLEWGVEAFATHPFTGTGCSTEERVGAGGFLQLSWLGLERPRLTLGAHGGGELARAALALTGELGASYRFGSGGGFGIHTGVLVETIYLNAASRYQWLRNEAWVGGGFRVFGTYGEPMLCSIGRPLRSDAGLFALHARSDSARACAANAGRCIEAVGRAYERDAQLEHASIPAFVQLACELAQLHAPTELVARALDAARDELRHTELCMRLARRHLADAARPALPAIVQRRPLARQDGVVRLAIESWLDGCLNEGRAAAHAARAAELASDAEARAVQHAIAIDEHRHAELAWSILRWSLDRGGEQARSAVAAAREIGGAHAADEVEPDGLEANGRLSPSTARVLAAQHLEASHERLDALLA